MTDTNARESQRVKRILTYLNGLAQVKAIKMHGSPFMAGHPDIFCSYHGRAVLLEVKRPGNAPTEIQAAKMSQWHASGAVVEVVHDLEEVQAMIARVGLR